jgi:bidirectional [NiFe] hydrogenase diaphorase subunit
MAAGIQNKPIAPPSDDKRWRIVAATMRRHGYSSDALIETLHTVQESFGFIDEDAMRFVASSLGVSHSRVYGVATFYNFFNLKPQGKHTCVVCLGTACYIKGGPALIQAVEQTAGIHPDETTPDKQVSLIVARCIGACGLAPAAVFDGDVAGKLEPAEAIAKIKEWMNHAD